MEIKEKIKKLSKKHKEEIIKIRRDLHENPELSFKEYYTSAYIEDKLKKYDVEYKKGFVKTGIVAWIKGEYPGGVVGLRSELDALPITESNKVIYKSKRNGIMHACGHDAHTAMLLGVIKVMQELKEKLAGTILFIFQPAEELIPGGAGLMIKEGALDIIKPDLILAQHVSPELPTGMVGFKTGEYMASADEIYITIKGKGGHAAIPEHRDNTVLAAAKLLVLLDTKINASLKDKPPTVFTFGKVDAPGATNVIPSVIQMAGTLRTFDEKWRKTIHEKIKDIISEFEMLNNLRVILEIKNGFPVLENNINLTKSAISFSKSFLGEKNVVKLKQRMTSEDFAYYSQYYPVCFYRLGSEITGKETSLHRSDFNIDERVLTIGTGNLSWLAYSFLQKISKGK